MGHGLSLPLRKLEASLAALPAESDAMMLSELDGFLTGIMVCPELISPSEWLPVVWGGGDIENVDATAFASAGELDAFCKLVIKHYNSIGVDLERGGLSPIYDVDERHDAVLWEMWITGFARAMTLRPDSWAEIAARDDEDATAALAMLISLVGVDDSEMPFTKEQMDEIIPLAPNMIPFCVDKLHAWRVKRDRSSQPVTAHAKIGRNEPCYCGSGRKYKKCCGAN